jgi:hypothetical protein
VIRAAQRTTAAKNRCWRPAGREPVQRVVVTHMHPIISHGRVADTALCLSAVDDPPEYVTTRMLTADTGREAPEALVLPGMAGTSHAGRIARFVLWIGHPCLARPSIARRRRSTDNRWRHWRVVIMPFTRTCLPVQRRAAIADFRRRCCRAIECLGIPTEPDADPLRLVRIADQAGSRCLTACWYCLRTALFPSARAPA